MGSLMNVGCPAGYEAGRNGFADQGRSGRRRHEDARLAFCDRLARALREPLSYVNTCPSQAIARSSLGNDEVIAHRDQACPVFRGTKGGIAPGQRLKKPRGSEWASPGSTGNQHGPLRASLIWIFCQLKIESAEFLC
jgi:hypothetical protein